MSTVVLNHPVPVIGFTGSQQGMTQAQYTAVYRLLVSWGSTVGEFHHGDCVGADAQAHGLAAALNYKIVVHPPLNPDKRAFCASPYYRPARSYLDRNRDIVTESHIMIATPKEAIQQLRSGTWATIRAAKRIGRHVVIVAPDGSVWVQL